MSRRWDFIAEKVHENHWRMGVEVGVYNCKNLSNLLELCPALHMHAVDPMAYVPGQIGTKGEDPFVKADWESCRHTLDGLVNAGHVTPWIMTSVQAAARFPSGWVDFVFIDGDHSYRHVLMDIILWSQKLRDHGWLIGHDINFPSVQKAVETLCPGYETGPDNTWHIPLVKTDLSLSSA